jgi:hypothetical protein
VEFRGVEEGRREEWLFWGRDHSQINFRIIQGKKNIITKSISGYMGFVEKIVDFFSNNKKNKNLKSKREFEKNQNEQSTLYGSIEPAIDDGNVNIVDSEGIVEGRYIDDLNEPTEEERFRRDQQRIINELKNAYIPEYAVCSVSGCNRKKDSPLFVGQDGKYYCRDHILPENSGRPATGKPPLEGGIISYRSDGKIEFRK